MQYLHEVLAGCRDEMLGLWSAKLRESLLPESPPHLELVDEIPIFLEEVEAALRRNLKLESSQTAPRHGEQRLRMSFSIDGVVREYGFLREAIIEVAHRHGVALSLPEHEVLSSAIITGIAEAVSEFVRQRDVELQRQATEHFAFIAHEIRNPLSSAMLALSVLKDRGLLPESARTVQVLRRSLEQVHGLVEESLRVARVSSGVALHRERVDVRALLEEASDKVAYDAEHKGVHLHVQAASDLSVNLDTRLIGSALSNLVRNGVKFTPRGGGVILRGQLRGAVAIIEVEDSCGGLDPGAEQALFKPFVQLGTDKSGFGLGLAITKQAVDAHGGALRVQNLPGKGCIFVIELPDAA